MHSKLAWRSVGRLGLALFSLLLAALALHNPLAVAAVSYAKEGMAGGAALYGTLRVINSVMSVAKDADIQASAAVASATFSPGQLLQPVTETLGRIADLLFVLTIGSGVVSVLIGPVATAGAAIGTVAALGIAILPIRQTPAFARLRGILQGSLTLGISAALIVPGAFAAASIAGDRITQGAWSDATAVFDGMRDQIGAEGVEHVTVDGLGDEAEKLAPAPDAQPISEEGYVGSAFAKLGTAWKSSKDAVATTARAATDLVGTIQQQVGANARIINNGVAVSADLFHASVQIAVAYIIKLVVLPLIIFFSALFVLRGFKFDTLLNDVREGTNG